MAYCSNCGKEVSDTAAFCGNCGNPIKKATQKAKSFESYKGNFDLKSILITLKNYFTQIYVDYNSKIFKFAMILFLAIGIGEATYSLVLNVLPSKAYEFLSGMETILRFVICGVCFGLFSIFILRLRPKETVKKSNFLMVFWIVMLVLNLLVFIADFELYKYILFNQYAVIAVEILTVVSTAILLFKNRPKYPIILAISALSYILSRTSFWNIKTNISLYKIYETVERAFDIINSMRNIILVLALFLLIYIIPKKISKWLVYILATASIVLYFINMIEDFEFTEIFSFIIQLCVVAMLVLFALSCSRKINYEYVVEGEENLKKRTLKIGIFSTGSVLVIVVSYLLISAIVCSMHINAGIKKWKDDIINAQVSTDARWTAIDRDIFKYRCDEFATQFIDENYLYETLRDNRYKMEKISKCYSAYTSRSVNDDIIDEFLNIYVSESWKDDSVLSSYYEQYEKMKPNAENVSVRANVDVSKGEIEITVKNDNLMPISKCTVDCNFTILFIESGSYSSNEYGRGTKTIEVEDIAGKSEKSETITFNPDDYYDSYGSYLIATLMDKSVNITSIE